MELAAVLDADRRGEKRRMSQDLTRVLGLERPNSSISARTPPRLKSLLYTPVVLREADCPLGERVFDPNAKRYSCVILTRSHPIYMATAL